jgi:hypothetical protein
MSNKKAYLVKASFMTRVIAEEDAEERDIEELARDRIAMAAREDFFDNVEEVEEDEECPYNPETDE